MSVYSLIQPLIKNHSTASIWTNIEQKHADVMTLVYIDNKEAGDILIRNSAGTSLEVRHRLKRGILSLDDFITSRKLNSLFALIWCKIWIYYKTWNKSDIHFIKKTIFLTYMFQLTKSNKRLKNKLLGKITSCVS